MCEEAAPCGYGSEDPVVAVSRGSGSALGGMRGAEGREGPGTLGEALSCFPQTPHTVRPRRRYPHTSASEAVAATQTPRLWKLTAEVQGVALTRLMTRFASGGSSAPFSGHSRRNLGSVRDLTKVLWLMQR